MERVMRSFDGFRNELMVIEDEHEYRCLVYMDDVSIAYKWEIPKHFTDGDYNAAMDFQLCIHFVKYFKDVLSRAD